MKVNNKHYRTIWLKKDNPKTVQIIDQTRLPHEFVIADLKNVEDAARAIKDMLVRGAGLIGVTAGFGMYLAALEIARKTSDADQFTEDLEKAGEKLITTRPTATNLAWAVKRQLKAVRAGKTVKEKVEISFNVALEISDEDAENCKKIGEHGVKIIEELSRKKNGQTVNILTHCNAGWLAFADYGSALSPIYTAFDRGVKIHVWVDETRPRNQGAGLTSWELGQHGVSHTVIVDNAGGHLMQHGLVDMAIVGADRMTRKADAANKIGTYLKALAAKDNDVPFYFALPGSTIDWSTSDGIKEIPIEERDGGEVKYISGLVNGEVKKVLIMPEESRAANYAFDVTPARLITGVITERGICKASEQGLLKLYPEQNKFIALLMDEN